MSENSVPAGAAGRGDEDAPARREDPRGTGRLVTQRAALGIGFVALLVGAALGAIGDRVAGGGDDPSQTRGIGGEAALSSLPSPPLLVTGASDTVDEGFEHKEAAGAVTITVVRTGEVEVRGAGEPQTLRAGQFFVSSPTQDVTFHGQEDGTRIDVFRLAPQRAAAP